MSKVSDYKIEKFVSLKDTPNEYIQGKYVTVEANGIDYGDVETSSSGSSGGGLNYNYYFDTATDGNIASGTVQLNSTNYPAVSTIDISYYDKDGNDLSNWINSWDDSDNSVKGTVTFQSVPHVNKYAMFKLSETLDTTFGSGADGDVTISGTVNLNTTAVTPGRTYADMIAYNVSSVGLASCQTTEIPNGIEANDAVLLINIQGAGNSQIDNVGNYEVFIVDSIVSTTVSFKSNKTKLYGNNGGDTNLGTGSDKQKVMLMRIPQYDNMTIQSGASITATTFDTAKYGIVCIMCKTKATIIGEINTDALGFEGGSQGGHTGASYGRGQIVTTSYNPNLGGGATIYSPSSAAGAGSYGSRGSAGNLTQSYTYGNAELSKVYLGSGGGGHYHDAGGDGGGAIMIFAKELDVYNNISSLGSAGPAGTGGSGGSVLVKTNKITMNSGNISSYSSSNGGTGRIAIYYNALMDSLSNVNPTPYTDSLTSGADKVDYNTDWLNNSGTFEDGEEIIVSYAYNY